MSINQYLRDHNIRPTRQRLRLARLLFVKEHMHITAEEVYEQVCRSGEVISLATVYNTLNHFTAVGLLKKIRINEEKTIFDTKVTNHHHFYLENEDRLIDIDSHAIQYNLPPIPKGKKISSVDVVIRLCDDTPPRNIV